MPDPYPPPNDGPDLSLLGKYPVLILAGLAAAVVAVLQVLVEFGIDISDEQQSAISKAIYAVGGLVLLIMVARHTVGRRKVISQVTNQGTIVAGDAALEPTGTELVTAADARGRAVPLATAKRSLATAVTVDIPYQKQDAVGLSRLAVAEARQDVACRRFHPGQDCRPGQNHPTHKL